MKNPNLQLMVHGANVRSVQFSVAYPGVRLAKVTKSENNNYAFLDLVIAATAKPGKMKIRIVLTGGSFFNSSTLAWTSFTFTATPLGSTVTVVFSPSESVTVTFFSDELPHADNNAAAVRMIKNCFFIIAI